jgi:hypothetical protein
MQQIYHANAKTNVHIREQIQKSSIVSNNELAFQFNLSTQRVSKWKNRDFLQDVSSRPHNIHYALSGIETALIVSIRKSSWIPLDEIYEMMLEKNKTISRSSVYRCLIKNDINKVSEKQKDKAKKFKAYDPGYLHMDVTYLPQFNGKKTVSLCRY